MAPVKTYLCFCIPEERVVLKRILLIVAIVGIAVAHGAVLYKIDTGVRSADANQAIGLGNPQSGLLVKRPMALSATFGILPGNYS